MVLNCGQCSMSRCEYCHVCGTAKTIRLSLSEMTTVGRT